MCGSMRTISSTRTAGRSVSVGGWGGGWVGVGWGGGLGREQVDREGAVWGWRGGCVCVGGLPRPCPPWRQQSSGVQPPGGTPCRHSLSRGVCCSWGGQGLSITPEPALLHLFAVKSLRHAPPSPPPPPRCEESSACGPPPHPWRCRHCRLVECHQLGGGGGELPQDQGCGLTPRRRAVAAAAGLEESHPSPNVAAEEGGVGGLRCNPAGAYRHPPASSPDCPAPSVWDADTSPKPQLRTCCVVD